MRSPAWSLLVLFAACAPPPLPPAPPVDLAGPRRSIGPTAPPLDPAGVSVLAATLPAGFALDGTIAEWGSLVPARPSAPEPEPPPDPEEDAPAAPVLLPASHVALALTSDGAVVAADLTGASKDGVWIGIGFAAPPFPPLGYAEHSGAFRALECDTDAAGYPNPPEAVAACHALLVRHDAQVTAHLARFRRLYRLDREGVRAVGASGALLPVEGAKAIFKDHDGHLTLEATLPAGALPRAAEAPVGKVFFVARPAMDAVAPEVPSAAWVPSAVPEPASFEPLGALRADAFVLLGRAHALAASYQPGDAQGVEDYAYDDGGPTASPHRHALYEPQHKLGDLEIGYLFARGTALAVLRKGQVLFVSHLVGRPIGIVEHGADLHVLSYEQATSTDTWTDSARWSAVAVHPDGTFSIDLVDQTGAGFPWSTHEVNEFHDAAVETFGIRGTSPYAERGDGPIGREITWRFDPRTGRYLSRSRTFPVPKTAPATKGKPRGSGKGRHRHKEPAEP